MQSPNRREGVSENPGMRFTSNIPDTVKKALLSNSLFEYAGEKLSRREIAERKWYIPRFSNDYELKNYVKRVFKDYYTSEANGDFFSETWSQQTREIYKQAINLLIISDIARPITAGDWKVDRTTAAEKNLGLKQGGLALLEERIQEGIGIDTALLHLHKGQWNGAIMLYLQQQEREEVWKRNWQERGISDKLYFPIEDIILNHLSPEWRENTVVQRFVSEILCPITKRKLKAQWFESKNASIGDWKDKVPFCDMNDIYSVLAEWEGNIQSEIRKRVDFRSKKYMSSKDYTDDSWVELDDKLRYFILRLLWEDTGEIKKRDGEQYIAGINQGIEKRKRQIDFFQDDSTKQDEKTLRKKRGILAGMQLDSETPLNIIIQKIEAEIESLEEEKKKITGEVIENNFPQSLSEIFDFNFLSGAENQTRPNLNMSAYLYFGGVNIGWFTDIPQLFPQQKFALISSSKGDSHEPDEVYKRDIQSNIQSLQKGWVYISDGIKWSFSRIYRLDIIQEIVTRFNKEMRQKGTPKDEYKILALLDTKNRNKFLSCIVMRRSDEDMFLVDASDTKEAEWWVHQEELFEDGIVLRTARDALELPFIDVMGYVRRQVLNLTDSGERTPNVDIFKGLHKRMIEIIRKTLMDFAKVKFGDAFSDDTSLIETMLQDGKIGFSHEEIEAIKREASNRVRILFAKHHLVEKILIPGQELTTLGSWEMLVFAKKWHSPEKWNVSGLIYPIADLATNDDLCETGSERQRKIDDFKKKIRGMLEKNEERKPILLLDYIDCEMNDILKKTLERIYGEDFCNKYIVTLPIEFHTNGKISNRGTLLRSLREWKRKWGIIIGGGSWKVDADNKYGESMKELWRELDIYESLTAKNGTSRILALCSSYQTMTEVLWEWVWETRSYTDEAPKTQTGMFKFLPLVSEILDPKHPLFRSTGGKNPRNITLCHSNAGQLDIPENRGGIGGLEVLSRDATGIPSIVSLCAEAWWNSFFWIQAHPEFNPDIDIQAIQRDIIPFWDALQRNFWYSVEQLLQNYKNATVPHSIRFENTEILILRALYELTKGF